MSIHGKDLREVLSKNYLELKEQLKEVKLDSQTKDLLLLTLEFGYAAAHSSRTYDMHQAFMQAQRCTDTYHDIEKTIENMETSD